jgi:hypothetical protein
LFLTWTDKYVTLSDMEGHIDQEAG